MKATDQQQSLEKHLGAKSSVKSLFRRPADPEAHGTLRLIRNVLKQMISEIDRSIEERAQPPSQANATGQAAETALTGCEGIAAGGRGVQAGEQNSAEASEGSLPPYAHEYMRQHGSVPWASFKQGHKSGPQLFTAPWLSLLPPEAKGSLYEWGRYLFSQTALCQRGSVSVDMYGEWVLDALIASKRTSAADTLAKCCAAFAYSPLSVVIDIRAALQCISLALREVHGTERGTLVLPSYVEDQLDFVCAAGCGSQLVEGCIRIGRYSHRIKYCSEKCAQTHVACLTEALDIYLCWPRGRVDSAYVAEVSASRKVPDATADLDLDPEDLVTETESSISSYVWSYYRKRQKESSRTEEELANTLYAFKWYAACRLDTRGCEYQVVKEFVADFDDGQWGTELAYTAMVAYVYQHEHLFHDIREAFPDFLPPRPPVLVRTSTSATDSGVTDSCGSGSVSEQPIASIPAEQTALDTATAATALALSSEPAAVASSEQLAESVSSNSEQPADNVRAEPRPPTQPTSHPTPPTPESHTTPATTHAPHSPCTTVQRLTEADLARISDLARDARADASRDARPMLWHVRRRAYERACARMGLPAAGVQSLLWVASERGDAWGSLTGLAHADPFGLCLPPELRTPYYVWVTLSVLTSSIFFYTLGEAAMSVIVEGVWRGQSSYESICALCGKHVDSAADISLCTDCGFLRLCSEACCTQHHASGACALLKYSQVVCDKQGQRIMPLSFTSLPAHTAHTASDQQAPHTSDLTPHPSSPLQTDASTTAGYPAAAAVPAPSRSVSAQRTRKRGSAAQALAAEYRQCVEGNALLQRVAEVVMPRGAEHKPESAAVMAAQQLLIAASGLLDAGDLEEVLAAAGA